MNNEKTSETFDLREWIANFNKLIEGAKGLANATRIYSKVMPEDKYHYLYPLYNKSHFAAMGAVDLLIGLKYLYVSEAMRNSFEANYFARVVALHTYEILSVPSKLLDKDVRLMIIDRLGEDALTEINETLKKQNDLKKTHGDELKKIRHNVIAHKANYAMEQAEIMRGISTQRIYEVGYAVAQLQSKITSAYITLLTKLLPNPA